MFIVRKVFVEVPGRLLLWSSKRACYRHQRLTAYHRTRLRYSATNRITVYFHMSRLKLHDNQGSRPSSLRASEL
jgi:hypothetical protein